MDQLEVGSVIMPVDLFRRSWLVVAYVLVAVVALLILNVAGVA